MDLNKMVSESLAKMEAEGKVQQIIDKHIESTVDSVVKDTFGSWSDFGKDLKGYVKENLQINFRDLNIASYNHLILKAVQDLLDDQVVAQGVTQVKEQLESLLSNTKREYKLSELVQELTKEIEGLDELGYEEYHEMSLYVDESYSSHWIGLDARSNMGEYDCKYRLLVTSEGKLAVVRIYDKDYGRSRDIKDFDIKAVMNGLHGLEETLFKIYTSGARIILDEENCELEISNPEYD